MADELRWSRDFLSVAARKGMFVRVHFYGLDPRFLVGNRMVNVVKCVFEKEGTKQIKHSKNKYHKIPKISPWAYIF